MKILGIETSCDETAISLIEVDALNNCFTLLGNTVHSQIDVHVPYGGVFPILAKREHAHNLVAVLKQTLDSSDIVHYRSTPLTLPEGINTILGLDPELLTSFKSYISTVEKPPIDLLSVTIGPGLEPALWVGISFAKALSYVWNIPVVAVNHMEGHILTSLIKKVTHKRYDLLSHTLMGPSLALLVSGGHTQIVLVNKSTSGFEYGIIGETRDDAIGECFDKVARMLGLSYPGGPKISKLAHEARLNNIQSPEPLPRPMIKSMDFDFSFSGLKTAVLYLTQKLTGHGTEHLRILTTEEVQGICREVEDAVTDVVVTKIRNAAEMYITDTLIIGGGVSANTHLRQSLEKLAQNISMRVLLPEIEHSTDNGLMSALAGYFSKHKAVAWNDIPKAQGTLPLGPRVN